MAANILDTTRNLVSTPGQSETDTMQGSARTYADTDLPHKTVPLRYPRRVDPVHRTTLLRRGPRRQEIRQQVAALVHIRAEV